ncbi:MAG: hypothetical protein CMO63_06610 [Verrucomicrobiales bacterium]|nr:hypothetical protein [Verrucomicrobiales bacterium]
MMARKAALLGVVLSSWVVSADEPIMNMMPRWDNGWGLQLIDEYRRESDLLLGDETAYSGFTEDVHLLHFQGVYTWDRSIRLTYKLPYVLSARREMPDGLGGKYVERDNGIGDATLALPLKKYFNLDGRSGSWTLKPMLRVPLAGEDDYEIYDNKWGGGLGLGYEFETHRLAFVSSASYWDFEGDKPSETGFSLDLGYKFYPLETNSQILWETDFLYKDNGTETLLAGPAFYWNFNDTTHMRLEWKHDFHDRQGTLDHGNGDRFLLSLGIVF